MPGQDRPRELASFRCINTCMPATETLGLPVIRNPGARKKRRDARSIIAGIRLGACHAAMGLGIHRQA